MRGCGWRREGNGLGAIRATTGLGSANNRRGIPPLRGAARSPSERGRKSRAAPVGMTGLGALAELVAKISGKAKFKSQVQKQSSNAKFEGKVRKPSSRAKFESDFLSL
jgi:hypothetical protein